MEKVACHDAQGTGWAATSLFFLGKIKKQFKETMTLPTRQHVLFLLLPPPPRPSQDPPLSRPAVITSVSVGATTYFLWLMTTLLCIGSRREVWAGTS